MVFRKSILWLLTFLIFLFSFSSVLAQTELSVSIGVGDTILTLKGLASPNSQVTIKESGAVVGTTTAGVDGSFSKSLLNQTSGMHTVSIYSTDKNGLATATITYSISLTAFAETTLANIILPPTVSFAQSQITKGENLGVSGLAAPSSTITLVVTNSVDSTTQTETAVSLADGSWSFSFDTNDSVAGIDYVVTVRVTTSAGYQSEASSPLSFTLNPAPTSAPAPTSTPTPSAVSTITPTVTPILTLIPTSTPTPVLPIAVALFDINGNDKIEKEEILPALKKWVNIWRTALVEKIEKLTCDLNNDGKCNLVDFSILMYYVGR